MVFHSLVWNCFHNGTSLSENRVGIRIEPRVTERILFFRMDCEECRAALGLQGRVCDALVFYREGTKAALLIFVEFKGRDFERAASQLTSTFQAVVPRLPAEFRPPRTRVKGLIISSAGAPTSQARIQQELSRIGLFVEFVTGAKKPVDLRPLLR